MIKIALPNGKNIELEKSAVYEPVARRFITRLLGLKRRTGEELEKAEKRLKKKFKKRRRKRR